MREMPCTCVQKMHRAPLEDVVIEDGAIRRLPEILKNYHRIYLIADENTYAAAGREVEAILTASGQFSHKVILEGDSILPNEQTLGRIALYTVPPEKEYSTMTFPPLPDLFLAVGSGVVNDTTRCVSYRFGIPFAVVATAPSMDGYASAGSPTLFNGSKATVKCTTPRYIIADLNVVSQAPYPLLLAGIGDMLGKYTAMLDWELARDYIDEYYCEKIAGQVIDATNLVVEHAAGLVARDHKTVHSIIEGLIVTGVGMAYTGCSRPASGCEHMIGHAWEILDVKESNKPNLHGLEVAEGTLVVIALYRRLFRESQDAHLKELIAAYLPYFEKVEEICHQFQLPLPVKDRERIYTGILNGSVLRKRYSVLEYLKQNGRLETYAAQAADEVFSKYYQ